MKNLYNLRLTILYFILISIVVSQTTNSSDSSNSTNSTVVNNTTDNNSTTTTTNTTTNTANITFPDLNISNSTARVVPNYLCTPTGNLAIDQNTTICIHFYPHTYRMAFNLTVDKYSVLSIGGAYSFAYQDTPAQQGFVFQIGDNHTISSSLYYDKTNSFVIPVFNIVIKVNQGVVYDVVWDNDCYSCLTSDTCYTNSAASYLNDTSLLVTDKNCKMPACANSKLTAFQCDPRFYVTWFGTDVNGKQLKSSNLSMSRFRQYAVGSLYNSAKDAFNSTVLTLQNTWDLVVQTTNSVLSGNFTNLK